MVLEFTLLLRVLLTRDSGKKTLNTDKALSHTKMEPSTKANLQLERSTVKENTHGQTAESTMANG